MAFIKLQAEWALVLCWVLCWEGCWSPLPLAQPWVDAELVVLWKTSWMAAWALFMPWSYEDRRSHLWPAMLEHLEGSRTSEVGPEALWDWKSILGSWIFSIKGYTKFSAFAEQAGGRWMNKQLFYADSPETNVSMDISAIKFSWSL